VRRARRASSTMCLEMVVDPARQARFLSTRSVTHKGQVRASSARICRETFTSRKPRSPCALSARPTHRTVEQQELRYSTASVNLDSGAPTDKPGLSVTLGEYTISKALAACLNCTCVHAYRISSAATVDSGMLALIILYSSFSFLISCPSARTSNENNTKTNSIVTVNATLVWVYMYTFFFGDNAVLLELNAPVVSKASSPLRRTDIGRPFTLMEQSMGFHSSRPTTLPCPRPSSVVPTSNRAKQTTRVIMNTQARCADNVHQNFTTCWGFVLAVLAALS